MKFKSIITGATILCFITFYAIPLYAEQDNSDLRLALSQVTIYAETNRTDKAFALLDKLKTEYPNNPEVLVAEADLNLRVGNRGSGFELLNQAAMLAPYNEDILDRQRSAFQFKGSFVSPGFTIRRTNQATEQITSLSGQTFFSNTVSGGVIIENNHLRSRDPITRFNGVTSDFEDDLQRATLSLNKIYMSGNEASALLYLGSETIGGGLGYSWWDRHGTTTLQANLQKPDWSYVESIVGDGTKDNIRLSRKQHITQNFEGTIGGGFNRYGLEDDEDVATSSAVDMNLGYRYPYAISKETEDNIMLGVDYSLDAEYFADVEERTDPNGFVFSPLPANSFEVHSLTFSASKHFLSQYYVEGFGGYAKDRLGDDGPLFGAVFNYTPINNLGIELMASRGIMGERESDTVDLFSANVRWSW